MINAATSEVTNARAEAINSRIQWIKKMACGFRSRKRFREAIYFHLGGLDLIPGGRRVPHETVKRQERSHSVWTPVRLPCLFTQELLSRIRL